MSPRVRAGLADAAGLVAMMLLLLDYLRPSLLFLPTIAAGGDTPCHFPTAVAFCRDFLPQGRLHGWYPGSYLGHPLLLYYFPFPFLVMAGFAPFTGLPVAFKLGTALGVFLLPLLTYVSFRLMGFRSPTPLLGAAGALVFVFLEENPIWGGTMASTLTGEFSYTYGLGFALLFLGVTYRAVSRGSGFVWPALALALTALAHGYAVLWAGLAASFFLFGARRPGRTLGFLLTVAGVAFALAGFFLVPLLGDWGWTTPYDDAWITISWANLLPLLLAPLFLLAAAGLVWTCVWGRRAGGADRRLLFLGWAALIGAALTAAGPALGIIDVRFMPFFQLALALCGAATAGLWVERLAVPRVAALGLVLLAMLQGDLNSRLLRYWVDWNYTGLEAKELWPAFDAMTKTVQGTVADPRVAVEYNALHEKAGSIRMYEMIPHFIGRPTLEGVYNQASLMTHPVYYLASEMGAASPNPFKSRYYSRFDLDAALVHLRLLHAGDVVALSRELTVALHQRPGVSEIAHVPPYTVFRLPDPGGYVEPLAYQPVRSSPRGWRDKAYRWFTRKPLSPAHLVFTDDPRFALVERDEWLPPPEEPLPGGARVTSVVEAERIHIQTDRPGHPLLVKVSYHPRWHATGGDGPYLLAPGLMMVVPHGSEMELRYARTGADRLGWALSGAGLLVVAAAAARRRWPAAVAPTAPVWPKYRDSCALPPPGRQWGFVIPAALAVALCAARGLSYVPKASPVPGLMEQASAAYAADRFADAAEYARVALDLGATAAEKGELLALRGESLLRAGQPQRAREAFETVIVELADSPYRAQALSGSARASDALGDAASAAGRRSTLQKDFADTPWAKAGS
jgi:6-pyruvoyl-tetrahydropterin synthase-like protein